MEKVIIREVRVSDMDELIPLCQAHAEYEKSEYSAEGKFIRLAAVLFSDKSPLKCMVAESEGQLIGYVTYMKQFSTWDVSYYVYMDCLYLNEASRGHGIGRQLMNCVVRYANEEYCQQIQWHTPTFNERAIKFYHDSGAFSKGKERFFLDL